MLIWDFLFYLKPQILQKLDDYNMRWHHRHIRKPEHAGNIESLKEIDRLMRQPTVPEVKLK
jgi:hypothetical protein